METSPVPLMRSRRAVRPPSGSRSFGGHLAPEAGASHIASAHPKCSLNKSSRSLQLCDFLGNSANAVRWQVWTALLLYVLMRFLCVMSRWSHSFTRLFTLLRATLWRKIDLWDLLSRIMSEIVQHNQMRGISEDVLRGESERHHQRGFSQRQRSIEGQLHPNKNCRKRGDRRKTSGTPGTRSNSGKSISSKIRKNDVGPGREKGARAGPRGGADWQGS